LKEFDRTGFGNAKVTGIAEESVKKCFLFNFFLFKKLQFFFDCGRICCLPETPEMYRRSKTESALLKGIEDKLDPLMAVAFAETISPTKVRRVRNVATI
jgi:hypothetical protein